MHLRRGPLCPHGYQLGRRNLGGKCFLCGDGGCCRCSNCGCRCCEQVSPRHVKERLRKLFPPLYLRLRYSKERMFLRIAEYIVIEPMED